MDKELMEKIFKTKSGKIGIAFLILSALSLCTCFINVENIGTGILGCILFFSVSGGFFYKGKKDIEKNSDSIFTDNNTTSVSISKKKNLNRQKKLKSISMLMINIINGVCLNQNKAKPYTIIPIY